MDPKSCPRRLRKWKCCGDPGAIGTDHQALQSTTAASWAGPARFSQWDQLQPVLRLACGEFANAQEITASKQKQRSTASTGTHNSVTARSMMHNCRHPSTLGCNVLSRGKICMQNTCKIHQPWLSSEQIQLQAGQKATFCGSSLITPCVGALRPGFQRVDVDRLMLC